MAQNPIVTFKIKDVGIFKAYVNSVNTLDIVIDLVKAVHKIPDAGIVVVVMLVAAVIPEKIDPVKELHKLASHSGVTVDIIENIAAVGCVRGIVREHAKDVADIRLLTFDSGQLLYDRVHSEVVDSLVCEFGEI